MPTPILRTKLHIPTFEAHELISRPRLSEKMNSTLARKLTLVAAPAGSGKSSLVCQWLQESGRPVAWLSLDHNDNHLTQFLCYVLAAIHQNYAHIGKELAQILQESEKVDHALILSELVNEIDSEFSSGLASDNKIILVLDDYHLITEETVHEAVRYLLDYLPPTMHIIMTTRVDPPFPLGRMRVKRQLLEIRGADLRFSQDELHDYFAQVMQLELTTTTVQQLVERTEGWIAGAQLAGLSLQGQNAEEAEQLLADLTGSDRYIADYLIDEVLQRQPLDMRNFLLQTSILETLSAPLCDAVTEQRNSHQQLRELDANNFFLIPLDNERQWYRYHHLFQELLQAQLQFEQANSAEALSLAHLHQRASVWYEQNDLPAAAIRHALAAEDFERAADLVELAARAMLRSYHEATLLSWVKVLPAELVRARPVLSVACAWALLDRGELEAAEAHLQDAERWLDTTVNDTKADLSERLDAPSVEMVVVDEMQFRSLPANIAAARAYHAQALSDVPGTEKYARRALDLLPEGDHFHRGIPSAILGLAYWASGDLEAALQSFADGMTRLRMTGNILSALSGTFVLADIRITQGRLHEAVSTYQQSLQLATEEGEPVLRGMAHLYVGLSELYCEWGDLEAATQHLLRSEELGKHTALHETPYRRCIALARIKEAQRNLNGALDLLHQAEPLYIRGPVPDLRPIAALKARMWIKLGRLTEALAWARERDLSVDDDLSYLREFEHITLTRILIAQYRSAPTDETIHHALELLSRLLQAAEDGERGGSVIEILILQAVAYEVQGNVAAALVALQRALTLANPEGYVRVFVDEGPVMATLLHAAAKDGTAPTYVSQLQEAFGEAEERIPATQDLVEPLNERELQVLRLAAAGHKNKEIATELMISLNTVLYHTKNLYGKLGVNKRTLALTKARELDLL